MSDKIKTTKEEREANGSASFVSFNTTTGITPSSSNLSAILLIIIIAPFF